MILLILILIFVLIWLSVFQARSRAKAHALAYAYSLATIPAPHERPVADALATILALPFWCPSLNRIGRGVRGNGEGRGEGPFFSVVLVVLFLPTLAFADKVINSKHN